MSSIKRITYEARDADTLWRCNRFILRHGPIYKLAFALVALLSLLLWVATGGPTVCDVFLMFLVVFIAPALMMYVTIRRLVKERTLCTTTLSDVGVLDQTSRQVIDLPWRKIRSIRFENGDIYFFSWSAMVYVPNNAFQDSHSAIEFYEEAKERWQAARNQTVAAKIASYEDPFILEENIKSQISEFDAQEESMWRELEDKHRKQQDQGLGK